MDRAQFPAVNIKRWTFAALGVLISLQLACSENSVQPGREPGAAVARDHVLRVATTTSTRDSGLLDELLPLFQDANHCRVDVVAVGTGAALKLGETGEVDAVLVHARDAELAFMDARHGIRHEEFMVNDFVVLGPPGDPAGIRDLEPVRAMKRIADQRQVFISRGDDSGTHKRELQLWQTAGGRPDWPGYIEAGQGMGPTLIMADEKHAYTLADLGTYLNFQQKINLIPLTVESESLRNPYAAIVVNPSKDSKLNARLADKFVDFLISPETQQVIAGFRVGGQQLFRPTRLAPAQPADEG